MPNINRGKAHSGLADHCYQAAGGNPWLALWLAINIQRIKAKHQAYLEKQAA